jgi:hypothetical protein
MRNACCTDFVFSHVGRTGLMDLLKNVRKKNQNADNEGGNRGDKHCRRHDILDHLRQVMDTGLEHVNQTLKNRINELKNKHGCNNQKEDDSFLERHMKEQHKTHNNE